MSSITSKIKKSDTRAGGDCLTRLLRLAYSYTTLTLAVGLINVKYKQTRTKKIKNPNPLTVRTQ